MKPPGIRSTVHGAGKRHGGIAVTENAHCLPAQVRGLSRTGAAPSPRQFRRHRTIEGFFQRLHQVVLGLCSDIETAGLIGEAFGFADALLAHPGNHPRPIGDDVHGEVLA